MPFNKIPTQPTAADVSAAPTSDDQVRQLQLWLEHERDDYASLQRECERMRDLLAIARCMLGSDEAKIFTKHAELIGIKL